jgi:hypothetical protein
LPTLSQILQVFYDFTKATFLLCFQCSTNFVSHSSKIFFRGGGGVKAFPRTALTITYICYRIKRITKLRSADGHTTPRKSFMEILQVKKPSEILRTNPKYKMWNNNFFGHYWGTIDFLRQLEHLILKSSWACQNPKDTLFKHLYSLHYFFICTSFLTL